MVTTFSILGDSRVLIFPAPSYPPTPSLGMQCFWGSVLGNVFGIFWNAKMMAEEDDDWILRLHYVGKMLQYLWFPVDED